MGDFKQTTTTIPEQASLVRELEEVFESETVELEHPDGSTAQVLVIPRGRTVIEVKKFLDAYLEKPERRTGTSHLTTLDSFIDHVNRHKDEHSIVFADVDNRQAPKLIGVIDYNRRGGPEEELARWGQHRAVYQFPVSDEWKAWTGIDGKPMSQADFAQFLEDRVVDVLDPAGAGEATKKHVDDLGLSLASPRRLLELSRGLQVNVGSRIKNNVNLSSGEGQIVFEEQHSDESGAPLKVPGAFALSIPVFRGGDLYSMPVRLRYRVQSGGVTWSFALARIDRTWDHAIGEASAKAQEKTGLPVLFGTPEK